jgi:thiosulfate/3-mercaptopyruvate sulfurtransferase
MKLLFRDSRLSGPVLLAVLVCAAFVLPVFAQNIPLDPQIPPKQMMSPAELNDLLKSTKPLILSIGPRSLYDQGHITGAEFIGSTSTPEGVQALKARVASLPKNSLIVVYCGCCPWSHCPNVHPAYKQLRNLGYTNVRVLYIANNLGADWVNKGYPTSKG